MSRRLHTTITVLGRQLRKNNAPLFGFGWRMTSSFARIIGFAGATNGGKSSICKQLKSELPKENISVTVFHMDSYYWEEDSPNHVLLPEFDYKYANWDDVCAVDWTRLQNDMNAWRSRAVSPSSVNRKQVLLVEGIMIFNHRPLLPYFDKKYFFTLPKDECWNRRRRRTYLPPEPENYFEVIAWPFYLKLKEELKTQDDIIYLDGTRCQDELLADVKKDILMLFRKI